MKEEEFREYLEGIKDTEELKTICKFIGLEDIDSNIYESIVKYLQTYHRKDNLTLESEPDYDYFKLFFESYRNKNTTGIVFDDEGYISLAKSLFLKQPIKYAKGKGAFTDCYMLMPDGAIYISKIPLNYKGISNVNGKNCRYAPLIATYIAKSIGVSTSENILARNPDGPFRILSKNFLKQGEELTTFYSDIWPNYIRSISGILSKLEEVFTLRKYSKEDIEMAKFEYLKQEFVAKLIGLKDQKSTNTGIIVNIDNEGRRRARIAPMFDYDYSFHIAKNKMLEMKECDNGKTDIGSLIEQYKDYPGFLEFARESN